MMIKEISKLMRIGISQCFIMNTPNDQNKKNFECSKHSPLPRLSKY